MQRLMMLVLATIAAGCAADAADGPPDLAAPSAPDEDLTSAGATPPASTSAIRIIVEPSDRGQALVDAIRGARTSIHVTMYLLTSTTVIDALVAQARAGREVRVILDQRFPPDVAGNPNQAAYDTLARAGAQVRWASSSFTYTHEKCVLLDRATAWIMTMNATASSAIDNREYLAIDDDADDVAEAEAIFDADFAGRAITPDGKLVVSPTDARPRLVSLIGAATATALVEGEELSDRAIVDALVARAAAGVAVTVVLPSTASGEVVVRLKGAGVRVVGLARPTVHAKALVVDDALAYVGSENFSTGSLLDNRELGVIARDSTAVQLVADTIAADAAAGAPL